MSLLAPRIFQIPPDNFTHQTQVRDCQFQMRMVWSSDALKIQGYSCNHQAAFIYGGLCNTTPKSNASFLLQIIQEGYAHMMKKGSADVVKVSKECEQTSP